MKFLFVVLGLVALCGGALAIDTPAECSLVSSFDHGLLRARDVDNTFSLYFNTPSMPTNIDWVDAHFIVNPTGSDFLPQHNFRISSSDGLMWSESRMGEGRIALAAGDRVVYSFTYSVNGVGCDTDLFEVTVPSIDIDIAIDNTLDMDVDESPDVGAFNWDGQKQTQQHGQTQQVGASEMQTQGISEPRIVHPTEEQTTNNGHEVVQPSIRASSSVKTFDRPALAMKFKELIGQTQAKATPQVQKLEQFPAKQ
jgi:hypothetical protein